MLTYIVIVFALVFVFYGAGLNLLIFSERFLHLYSQKILTYNFLFLSRLYLVLVLGYASLSK